jgi:hypothetical protein
MGAFRATVINSNWTTMLYTLLVSAGVHLIQADCVWEYVLCTAYSLCYKKPYVKRNCFYGEGGPFPLSYIGNFTVLLITY